MQHSIKIIFMIIAGNILDYYDFMLFAYLGSVITKTFIPHLNPIQTQIISLVLFSIPFLLRPLGGYFFGKIADTKSRENALGKTLQYAGFASFGIAILPGYEIGGFLSMIFFISLRAFQGFSLGGEYLTAGTLLMEKYQKHQGLLSGILGGSGSVGSLIAFSFAWFYLHDFFSNNAWRVAFALGGIVTYLSYVIRKRLAQTASKTFITRQYSYPLSLKKACLLTFAIGSFVGISLWTPVIYVNFYLTTVLNHPISVGLNATCIALLGTIFLPPLFGAVSDRLPHHEILMLAGAILAIPLSLLGFYWLNTYYILGQVFLTFAACIFPAPMHAVMNTFFPPEIRSRSVNTFFMIGASVGSLLPAASGYIFDKYQVTHFPLWILILSATITSILFFYYFKFKKFAEPDLEK